MYQRILVPLDGSETAEKVLPFVIGEAKSHGAAVVLLRVILPLRSSFMVSLKFQEQLIQQATEFSQNYLEKISQQLGAEGIQVEVEIQHGPVAPRILETAESTRCDLIIIGSHGEGGVIRWRFGGTAHKVVKTHTTIPVLVVST